MRPDVSHWSCDDVRRWLGEQGFAGLADLLCVRHRIDGRALLLLSEQDLRAPPLRMQCLGDIKRLAAAIDGLREAKTRSSSSSQNEEQSEALGFRCCGVFGSMEEFSADLLIAEIEATDTRNKNLVKTVLAFIYFCTSILITSLIMVIVHDRVPDSKTYPPLPDIVLDNIPLIPWAFDVCEVLSCFLGFVWVLVVLFHKHRLILMRRFFSLVGTVFLLRCITMLITSLSVPGVHLDCKSRKGGDWVTKIYRACEIWSGLGMSLLKVRSCGDYMFSGHTTVVTMFNHFITEYTPDDWKSLHTTSWVCNLFAIFFILAAHEHYSLDVFVAFYISSRLFLYYHSLAYHARAVSAADSRTRIWFPLFWFFESGGQLGRVTNEYEWPLPSLTTVCDCVNGLALVVASKRELYRQRVEYNHYVKRLHQFFFSPIGDHGVDSADERPKKVD